MLRGALGPDWTPDEASGIWNCAAPIRHLPGFGPCPPEGLQPTLNVLTLVAMLAMGDLRLGSGWGLRDWREPPPPSGVFARYLAAGKRCGSVGVQGRRHAAYGTEPCGGMHARSSSGSGNRDQSRPASYRALVRLRIAGLTPTGGVPMQLLPCACANTPEHL